MSNVETGLIEVKVIYPSAQRPVVKEFAPETTVRQVKVFVLDELGLMEGATSDGSHIVFFIFFASTKLDNLDQPISTFEHLNHKVNFRLAKEVIAG